MKPEERSIVSLILYYSVFFAISGAVHYYLFFHYDKPKEKKVIKVSAQMVKQALPKKEKQQQQPKQQKPKEQPKEKPEKTEQKLAEKKVNYRDNIEKAEEEEWKEKVKQLEKEKNEKIQKLSEEQRRREEELLKKQQQLQEQFTQQLAQISQKMAELEKSKQEQEKRFESKIDELKKENQQQLEEEKKRNEKVLAKKLQEKDQQIQQMKSYLKTMVLKRKKERKKLEKERRLVQKKKEEFEKKMRQDMREQLREHKQEMESKLQQERENLLAQQKELEKQILEQKKLLQASRQKDNSRQEKAIINRQWKYLEQIRASSLSNHRDLIRKFSTQADYGVAVPAINFFDSHFTKHLSEVMAFHKMELIAYPASQHYFISVNLNRPQGSGRYRKRTDFRYLKKFSNRTISAEDGFPQIIREIRNTPTLYTPREGKLYLALITPHSTANYMAWKTVTVCKKHDYDPKNVMVCNGIFSRTRNDYWSLIVTSLVLKDGRRVPVKDFEAKW